MPTLFEAYGIADAPDAPIAAPRSPERGAMRAVGDVGLSAARGVGTGVRMLTDLAGADNAASGGLRTVDDFLRGLQSARANADEQEVARIMKEAEGKGVLDQVIAAGKAFGVAPVSMAANALGTSVPTIAAAMIPGVGQAAMAGRLAGAGIGAAQGVGTVKGSIYDEVRANPLPGEAPEQTEARAVAAQEYGGKNAGSMVAGAGFGALAGSSGAERIVASMRSGAAGAVPGVMRRALGGAITEAVPEALQGGQEKYATNTALMNEGFAVDPWRGVAANAALEGMASAPIGGGFGAMRRGETATAPPPAGDAIRADKLPETGPLTRSLNAGVEAIAQEVDAATPTRRQEAAPMAAALALMTPEARQAALEALAIADNMQIAGSVRRRAQNRLDVLMTQVAPIENAPQAANASITEGGDQLLIDPAAAIAQREADRPPKPQGQVMPGDILNPRGEPFQSMRSTMSAQKANPGHEIVRVVGGLVVRKTGATDAEPVAPAPVAAGPAVGGSVDASGSASDVGLLPADAAGDGAPDAAGVAPGGGEVPPVGDAGQPDAALSAVAGEPIDDEWTAFAPETGTKGIPRAEMPQIKAVHRGAMVQFLKGRGILHEQEADVDPASLKPTQAEFSAAKAQKAREFTDTDRAILVSQDGHVFDGHHQWLAAMADNKPIRVIRLDAPIESLIGQVKEFPSADQADGATTTETPAVGPAATQESTDERLPSTRQEESPDTRQEGQQEGLLTPRARRERKAAERKEPAAPPAAATAPEGARDETQQARQEDAQSSEEGATPTVLTPPAPENAAARRKRVAAEKAAAATNAAAPAAQPTADAAPAATPTAVAPAQVSQPEPQAAPADALTMPEADIAALAGKTVAIEVQVGDTGKTATLTMDAAEAVRDVRKRLTAAEALVKCLA
jgi:hypothetical protein